VGPEAVEPISMPAPPRLHLQTDTVVPSLVRSQLRSWLTALAWPPGQRDDIVLAVSEAISNSVEHAYPTERPGIVELHAETHNDSGAGPGQTRRITITIRDHGRWRPAPEDDENRRRGIPIMRACMDTVVIEPLTGADNQPAGTRVTLISAPVPIR
jgi:anti-sigma regulatory factor (Ser/Thr protein kinase)